MLHLAHLSQKKESLDHDLEVKVLGIIPAYILVYTFILNLIATLFFIIFHYFSKKNIFFQFDVKEFDYYVGIQCLNLHYPHGYSSYLHFIQLFLIWHHFY